MRTISTPSASNPNKVIINRQFEKGFLSADCGEYGKDDNTYFPLYKPDIDGSVDAICTHIFNETVVLFSHENSVNYPLFLNEMNNIWMMLLVAEIATNLKVGLLMIIDALKCVISVNL